MHENIKVILITNQTRAVSNLSLESCFSWVCNYFFHLYLISCNGSRNYSEFANNHLLASHGNTETHRKQDPALIQGEIPRCYLLTVDSPIDANADVTVWALHVIKWLLQLLQICKDRFTFPCFMYMWRKTNWSTENKISAVMFLWHKFINVKWEDQVVLREFFLIFLFVCLFSSFAHYCTDNWLGKIIARASVCSVIALLSWASTELFYVYSISAEAIVSQSWRQDKKCLCSWDLWSTRKWHNRP